MKYGASQLASKYNGACSKPRRPRKSALAAGSWHHKETVIELAEARGDTRDEFERRIHEAVSPAERFFAARSISPYLPETAGNALLRRRTCGAARPDSARDRHRAKPGAAGR